MELHNFTASGFVANPIVTARGQLECGATLHTLRQFLEGQPRRVDWKLAQHFTPERREDPCLPHEIITCSTSKRSRFVASRVEPQTSCDPQTPYQENENQSLRIRETGIATRTAKLHRSEGFALGWHAPVMKFEARKANNKNNKIKYGVGLHLA